MIGVVVMVVLAVGIGVLARAAVWGETLASGPDWRLVARTSPFGTSITWEDAASPVARVVWHRTAC